MTYSITSAIQSAPSFTTTTALDMDHQDSLASSISNFLNESGSTDSNSSSTDSDTGYGEMSKILLAGVLLSTFGTVLVFFLYTIKSEILGCIRKVYNIICCKKNTRGETTQTNEEEGVGSLNDIIFDPEEEQKQSLTQSLLLSPS